MIPYPSLYGQLLIKYRFYYIYTNYYRVMFGNAKEKYL